MSGTIIALELVVKKFHKLRTLLHPARLARVTDIVRGAWASELERQRMAGWLERIAEEVGCDRTESDVESGA